MRYDHLDMLPEMAFRKVGKQMTLEGGGKKSKAPKAPDYMALAREESQMQKDINRETLAANRVNQLTPYGSLSYSQTGTDAYGNPTYTATQTLTPEQQRILGQSQDVTSGALGAAMGGLGNVESALAQGGVDLSMLPSVGINPGEMYSDAIMRRLQPNLERQTAQLESKLMNQGIAPGTEAWNNAKTLQAQQQNDLLSSAITQGMNVGLGANQQAFGQQLSNLQTPINLYNAMRTGSGVTGPTYVNPAMAQSYQAPDLTGAASNTFNAQMGGYNAAQQGNANFMGGLMGLGGLVGTASPGSLFGRVGSSIGGVLGF